MTRQLALDVNKTHNILLSQWYSSWRMNTITGVLEEHRSNGVQCIEDAFMCML